MLKGALSMWKKIVAAVGCGVLLWGGSPAMAAEQQNAMQVYKEAYMANLDDERALYTSMDLFGPNYHWELDAKGKVLRNNSMYLQGSLSWEITEKKTDITSHEDIPFYMENENSILTIYAQRAGSWGKLTLPGIPAELANVWRTGAVNFMDESLQAVKNVSIENETDKHQGLRNVMDAGKMIQISEKYLDDGTVKLSEKEKQEHKAMMDNLAKALQGTDLTVDWVVNKADRKTVTISTDLTPMIRAYARNVINDMAAGKIKLSDDEREMMESLGYFSELKFYMSYMGVNQNEKFTIPNDVRKSAVELLNLTDIQKGVSEAAQTGKK
jgi:hypothetical protein